MPLALTVCCFSKIQSGFTFLVPAHLGSPGKRAVKRVCCDVYISPVMAWCNQICVESADKSKPTNLCMHACLGRGTYRLACSWPLVASQNAVLSPQPTASKHWSSFLILTTLCLTGLPEVAMPYSDMWQDCQITFPHTRPCYAKSSYRSVDPQTLHGNVDQVDHVPNGPTNSAAITTMFPLRLCGGKLLVAAVTRKRRCGLSRLRVGDDDDFHTVLWFLPLKRPLSGCSSSTNISSYGLCDAEHSH